MGKKHNDWWIGANSQKTCQCSFEKGVSWWEKRKWCRVSFRKAERNAFHPHDLIGQGAGQKRAEPKYSTTTNISTEMERRIYWEMSPLNENNCSKDERLKRAGGASTSKKNGNDESHLAIPLRRGCCSISYFWKEKKTVCVVFFFWLSIVLPSFTIRSFFFQLTSFPPPHKEKSGEKNGTTKKKRLYRRKENLIGVSARARERVIFEIQNGGKICSAFPAEQRSGLFLKSRAWKKQVRNDENGGKSARAFPEEKEMFSVHSQVGGW